LRGTNQKKYNGARKFCRRTYIKGEGRWGKGEKKLGVGTG